ncbi:hypothetical protein PanWU01x14_057970, partial [Parasponia andersonii]
MKNFSGFATKSLLGDYKSYPVRRVEVLVLHLLLFVVVSWETDACKILKYSGGGSESVLRTLCGTQPSK